MALSTQRALPCLPWDESAPPWKYDVFLSFRGEDTRRGFTSHLYHELQHWQAFKTFKDDQEIEIGATISPELLSAIEQSHLAIVVLSPNYATSTWCLDELAKIVESMETRVLPVFLDVDPSDVRHQRGSFAEAFANHEKKFSDDLKKVERWRAALRKVANRSGWDSKIYGSERELIKAIVKYVWDKVRPTITLLHSTAKLVGMDFGLVELGRLLDLEAKDVRFIGIWGMGGVGKTTLAQLVFERISHQFEVRKFLGVREVFASHGTLVNLQRQLLSPILKGNIGQVWDERDGTSFIQRCLFNKKVLLVVDDVDHYNQLELLVGNKFWFGEGSRIIVTTRDKRLLDEHDIESFKVEGLNDSNSIELFSQIAFKKDKPEEGFSELSQYFVDYCKGLPLALKILGRSLYKRNLQAWNSALEKLKKIPNPTIIETLKLSYDALDETQKEVFLDVAFLCKLGMEEGRVIEMLDSCGFSGRIEIDVLIEKSLLTIHPGRYDNIVGMHGLVQEMAWDIFHPELNGEIGQRSHLFRRDDIFPVFTRNTGTEAIKCICLCLPKLEEADSSWSCEVFSRMINLRFLEFDNLIIRSGPKFLPNSLRILTWNWYPSKSLPASFRPYFLGELRMRGSKLVQLWDGKLDLPNLKTMNLGYSKNLIETPDFTGIPNLELLNLANCTGLVEIHPSIASNKKLKWLILHRCDSMKSFPSKLDLPNLETMDLSYCKSLIKTPDFTSVPNLEQLNLLYCTSLVEIHPSIASNKKLKRLILAGCDSMKRFPSKLEMDSLEFLNLAGCSKVKIPEFGEGMKNLSRLYVSGTASEELPSSIEHLVGLTELYLGECKGLKCLLGTAIFKPTSLAFLRMNGCSKLGKLVENTEEKESSITQKIRKLHGGVLGLIGRKSPEPLGLALPFPRALSSLRSLHLVDCHLYQGAIPDDIGYCFPSLEYLYLWGNNFVSLPTSIKCLSKLRVIDLRRCKRLQQLPDLPWNRKLEVRANDCDSLKMLSEPSQQGRFPNLEFFNLTTVNCLGLGDEEGLNDGIFSLLRRLAAQGISPNIHFRQKKKNIHSSSIYYDPSSITLYRPPFHIVSSGSKISEWFNIQSEGDSLTVELPPPDRKSEWTGIMFCVVFADHKNNPTVLEHPFSTSRITCFSQGIGRPHYVDIMMSLRDVKGDHVWVFYMSHGQIQETTNCRISFSFDTCYSGRCWTSSPRPLTPCSCLNSVKRCGARLLYEQDLKQLLLDGTMNYSKRSREF